MKMNRKIYNNTIYNNKISNDHNNEIKNKKINNKIRRRKRRSIVLVTRNDSILFTTTLKLLLSLLLLLSLSSSIVQVYGNGPCHNQCSGHGTCTKGNYEQCTCFDNWQGPDCSLRKCNTGTAFFDIATADDTAHTTKECSNNGYCNHKTGFCECRKGFEGLSCERLSCPKGVDSEDDCSGHGVCMTMTELGVYNDGTQRYNSSKEYSLWDSNIMTGCVCDTGYDGYDCSQRPCEKTDDFRTTGQFAERATLVCQCDATCSGSFTLTYNRLTTIDLSPTDTKTSLATAIKALSTAKVWSSSADAVETVSAGAQLCGAGSTISTEIKLNRDFGDAPPFLITSSLTTSGAVVNIYMETIYKYQCICGATCGGTVGFTYGTEYTSEIAIGSTTAQIVTAITALGNLPDDISILASFTSGSAMCESSATTTFEVTFRSKLGNLNDLGIVNGVTENGSPMTGSLTSVYNYNYGTTEHEPCSSVGTCDFSTGTCVCPEGWTYHKDYGECSKPLVKWSQFTGGLTCPGLMDSGYNLLEATYTPLLYISTGNYKNNSGIFYMEEGAMDGVMVINTSQVMIPGPMMLDLNEKWLYFASVPSYGAAYDSSFQSTIYRTRIYNNHTAMSKTAWETFVPGTNVGGEIGSLEINNMYDERMLYWSVKGQPNTTTGKIMRTSLTTTDGSATAILTGLHYPYGLALDATNDKLYYTLMGNDKFEDGKIAYCDLDGSNPDVLTDKNFTDPTYIALDIPRLTVYVVDSDHSNRDGTATIKSRSMNKLTQIRGGRNMILYNHTYFTHYHIEALGFSDLVGLTVDAENMIAYTADHDFNNPWKIDLAARTGTFYPDLEAYKKYSTNGVHRGMILDKGFGTKELTDYVECFGRGYCSESQGYKCVCYDGYYGNCQHAYCPTGIAWFDEPTATNVAHQPAVCSNRGTCDHYTGECACMEGFEGAACDRMMCPLGENGEVCSGNGRCMSMYEAAQNQVIDFTPTAYTYGKDPNGATTWDANKIYGCVCDSYGYEGVGGFHNMSGWSGYDCSQRLCPLGDDPSTTGHSDYTDLLEIQTFTCTATAGSFTLTFRGETTSAIAFDATGASFDEELEKLITIGTITVSDTTSSICNGVALAITFTTELGDVPALTITSSLTGGSGTIATTQEGTKKLTVCSTHGDCQTDTGMCLCHDGFSSSDGNGNQGYRGDCGFRDAEASRCVGTRNSKGELCKV